VRAHLAPRRCAASQLCPGPACFQPAARKAWRAATKSHCGAPSARAGTDAYYWLGVTRQPNPALLTSKAAAGLPWLSVRGERFSMWAPSNGPREGPQYAPYSHWGPSQWAWSNRHFTYVEGSNGDCVLTDLFYG
jgi:hypothetical protein